MQVHYRKADRQVVARGALTPPLDPALALLTLAPGEETKFSTPAGGWTVDAVGVLTALPLPPPPATRPKTWPELRADWDAAGQALQTATQAYNAPGATVAQKADALRDGLVATNAKLAAIAKALWRELNDTVPNA